MATMTTVAGDSTARRQTYFEMFGLEARYTLDTQDLADAWRRVQQLVHPDRHAFAGERERRISMEFAVRANEAYRTLRAPAARARYLLGLAGYGADLDDGASLPPEFLMAQFTWREAMDAARQSGDGRRVEALRAQLTDEMRRHEARLGLLIDENHNLVDAVGVARRLAFLTKVRDDIDRLIEELDA